MITTTSSSMVVNCSALPPVVTKTTTTTKTSSTTRQLKPLSEPSEPIVDDQTKNLIYLLQLDPELQNKLLTRNRLQTTASNVGTNDVDDNNDVVNDDNDVVVDDVVDIDDRSSSSSSNSGSSAERLDNNVNNGDDLRTLLRVAYNSRRPPPQSSALVAHRQSPRLRVMAKKALSLFAHWKPSHYTSNEETIPDMISAVARGHSRPLGGPLRWGRRRR
ncbi:uncharacterized protein LOC128956084 [Oppia nitens]|uniref:uncharacterized protein LOC128956084 n=1 Tax=Oppia nitens TaxID=1686743 RepID=UPI0023DAE5F3|nr:uncharacterized protein LOC128956084 [Oppia nitens]